MSFCFRRIFFIASSCLILFSLNNHASARTFRNAYISFEMKDSWKCKLEQTEFVCRGEDPQEAKEAVIILTAKEKGPSDSFPIYSEHLAKPVQMPVKTGGSINSQVTISPREIMINDQKWLDALHVNSEVQNYYTRYLATIKDQIAILITFTVHNKFYQKHSASFNDTVKSLRVIAAKDLTARTDGANLRGSSEVLGAGVGQALPSDLLLADESSSNSEKKSRGVLNNKTALGGLVLILAILAYVVIRLIQKRKK